MMGCVNQVDDGTSGARLILWDLEPDHLQGAYPGLLGPIRTCGGARAPFRRLTWLAATDFTLNDHIMDIL